LYTTLDWVTLGIWVFVIIVLVYGIIAIHDIPASVARKRNHPHVDAIEAAGWVSLFLLHALWPFLWIWAYYYKPELANKKKSDIEKLEARIDELQQRLDTLVSVPGDNNLSGTSTADVPANQNNEKEA